MPENSQSPHLVTSSLRPTTSASAATLNALRGVRASQLPRSDGKPAPAAGAHPRVALIGAGRIADTHAQALKEIGEVELTAVVDPVAARADALARKWSIPHSYDDLDRALAEGGFDAAHVLVPPPLHRPVAERCLAAGIDVLLEKPMAETDEDCAALEAAANAAGVALHINHNAPFQPAHLKLKEMVEDGSLGRPRHVACRFNMPLAQMQARQFGHWMFHSPLNLLLEQAVHPLSQIDDLVGPVKQVSVTVPRPKSIDGLHLQTTWLIAMQCERGTAELFVSLGESFPVWTMDAIFDDGSATADYLHDRILRQGASRWMDFWDSYGRGTSLAAQSLGQSHGNLFDYLLSTLKLKPRYDPFYRSMRGSIAEFHRSRARGAEMKGAQGRRMVALCRDIADKAGLTDAGPVRKAAAPAGDYDVLVIGGTGFIGRPVVSALIAQGKRVAVLARNTANLPPLFDDERVGVFRGDVASAADLERAMRGVSAVVNLAHAGGADHWAAIERAIVGGARNVAETCLKLGIERLIYVSTIASLYLGDRNGLVTGETPPDPNCDRRGDYSRAKAHAEHEMMCLGHEQGLKVTILRPGIVIGEGTSPFHSGIGFYNREQHCMGWNRGDNALPLVLAEDTAAAIALSLKQPQAIGKSYNVVGDVRLSARDYIAELARAMGRPLRYHPQTLFKQQAIELAKWLVKRAIGRNDAAFPSLADLRSRGMPARFDTSDIKRDLGWQPVSDRVEFIRRAIEVHARP